MEALSVLKGTIRRDRPSGSPGDADILGRSSMRRRSTWWFHDSRQALCR